MKLIGIELDEYASFSKIFVKLGSPINLLVGRNNAGKTALLRGISVLNLITRRVPAFGNPEEYCRSEPADREVRAKILLQLDRASARHFGLSEEHYVGEKKALLSIELLFVVLQGATVFGGCDLILEDKLVPLFRIEGSTQVFMHLGLEGEVIRKQRVGFSGHRQSGGRIYVHPIPDLVAAELSSLKPVLLVEAHREVISRVTLRAEGGLNQDASNLANFLLTLQGKERDKFLLIEEFVTAVFPEFGAVNPEPNYTDNTVSITLTEKVGHAKVQLTHCGTGVEQILSLATFVITGGQIVAGRELVLLLDEPHSYLHPDAERQLLEFLKVHPEHQYVIATHSPIVVNSVEPDAITYVERGESTDFRPVPPAIPAEVMRALGYQNSDFLFHNRLIFVEGESDQSVFPVLLKKVRPASRIELAATGFPVIHGVPGAGKPGSVRKNAKRLQEMILDCEKFLHQFGRANLPHAYLLDGDFPEDDRRLLLKLEERGTCVRFLKRLELENYILDPAAIATVLSSELQFSDARSSVTAEAVEKLLYEVFDSAEEKLFPLGKGKEAKRTIKGSLVLERIFEKYQLHFRKAQDGPLIARYVDAGTMALEEIWEGLNHLFE